MKARLFVLVLALTALTPALFAADSVPPGDTRSKEARACYDQAQTDDAKGDLSGAIAQYDRAIQIDPKYGFAYGDRGYAKSRSGDADGAMRDYNTALTLDPSDSTALNNRANAEMARDDLDHAIADYNEAIRLNPKFAHAYNGRGNACLRRDDLDQALTDFESALHLDPDYGHAYNGRGMVQLEQGDFDDAVVSFTSAIGLIPQYAHGYFNRGLTCFAHGRLDDALSDLKRSAQLNHGDNESRFLIWLILNRDPAQRAAATASLRTYLADCDRWGQRLGEFLLGDVSQVELVNSAFGAAGEEQKEELCQAYFYVAAKAELAGDAATADKFYRQCAGTGVTSFSDFIVATAKLESEPSYAGPKPMPPGVWINGQVTKQGHFFLFTTDKPVDGDSMKNLVVLGAASGLEASMANIFSHAVEHKSTVRLYGCLTTLADKTKDESGPLPNVMFTVWKLHMPGDPDVLPEKQKIYFHDVEKY